jgi:hypothetical protein
MCTLHFVMEYVVCDAVRYVTFMFFENFTSGNSYVVCGGYVL